ncbi:MAG: IS66 family insertion sequence element accessory protein TnpB [Saccharofermentanales bacterium]
MLNQFPADCRIYVACGYTDMRKQIDGLAALVQQQFRLDPFSRSFVIFCGRKRDRIKVLALGGRWLFAFIQATGGR